MAMVNSPLSGELDFAGQRDVALLGRVELPVHFEIAHQILPAVAGADIADRATGETWTAAHDEVDGLTLGANESGVADFTTPPAIAGAIPGDMRGWQNCSRRIRRVCQLRRARESADPGENSRPHR